jgi:hypothetical protein
VPDRPREEHPFARKVEKIQALNLATRHPVGSEMNPRVLFVEEDYPERTPPFDVQKVLDVKLGNKVYTAYHIDTQTEVHDINEMSGYVPSDESLTGMYGLDALYHGRVLMFQCPSRTAAIRDSKRYHHEDADQIARLTLNQKANPIDCIPTQMAHKKSTNKTGAKFQKNYYMVIFPDRLNNLVFGDSAHRVPMKLNVIYDSRGNCPSAHAFWRIAVNDSEAAVENDEEIDVDDAFI